MPNYKEMYFKLFNDMSNICNRIQEIQKEVEEDFMHSEYENFVINIEDYNQSNNNTTEK